MAFSTGGSSGPMAEINTTPLIDVMLVLLIIFMLTAPILAHRVRVDLPQKSDKVVQPDEMPEIIKVRVEADGSLVMNELPITQAALEQKFAEVGLREAKLQDVVQLRGANEVAYQRVTDVLTIASQNNVKKISFTELDE
jgi:biopolymer transport protein ExbD